MIQLTKTFLYLSRVKFLFFFSLFTLLYFTTITSPTLAATGDRYLCNRLQAIKLTEKIKNLQVKPFEVNWLKESIEIQNGPIFNNYRYDIHYSNKNSFTAANSTYAAIIRFSEMQAAAYLNFTFSTPFSVTAVLAECKKMKN